MIKSNLISKICIFFDSNVIGRIGGNIPEFFLDELDIVRGYKFYLTV
ncbi:Uncharacterised protein [Enterobacter kobei]|nr:Uncharacterised protein [Enterobacter kobei]